MKKLAIIDDETSLSEVLKLLISTMGNFEIETFDNAEDFIKRNEHYSFDIVFSDLNLPGGISGVECFKRISLTERKPQKMVIMTGDSDYTINDSVIDQCLLKPFNFSELKDCLG